MQSVPEKQSCGQTVLRFQCFPKQIFYCKYSQGVNQPLQPQQRWALLSFLPLLNTSTCWHSAAWGLLELEVACTLHLNKSCFHDYFLMPFFNSFICLASTSACGDEFSNVIICCVEYNFLLFVLRPSVCLFLLVLARNLELSAYPLGCPDLCHIPSAVIHFQEGDSRWGSADRTIFLSCEMPGGIWDSRRGRQDREETHPLLSSSWSPAERQVPRMTTFGNSISLPLRLFSL